MYNTSEFRKGLKIILDGKPYTIVENQFVKPGKGQAFNRMRIKNLLTGAVLELNMKSGDNVQKADVAVESMQYMYASGDRWHFMNTKTYDQVELTEEQLGEVKNYLVENIEYQISFWNGKAIGVEPPNFVEMQIVKCDPGARGDTVSGATKPATLSSGYTVDVPLFVEEGEWVRVDTRTGGYLDRVKR